MARMSSDTELKVVLKREVGMGLGEHVEGYSAVNISKVTYPSFKFVTYSF